MPDAYIRRASEEILRQLPEANTIRVDKDTDTLKFGVGGSGTTETEAVDVASAQTITGAKTFSTNPVVTGDGGIRYAEVAITNAELKALRAAPKTLVAAPGAGKVIQFLEATLLLDAGANVLTESTDNLAIRYTDGSGAIVSDAIETTGFIDQAGDTLTNARPKIDAIVAKAGAENRALVLHNTGDGEIAGNAANDATLRVKVWYSVLTTGW